MVCLKLGEDSYCRCYAKGLFFDELFQLSIVGGVLELTILLPPIGVGCIVGTLGIIPGLFMLVDCFS